MGPDLVTFQTEMSLEEVMAFYRDVLGKEGYTERVDLTVTAVPTFSMVFDGHESGKALAVQAVEMLRRLGYAAQRLEDGFPEWREDGLPVEVTK